MAALADVFRATAVRAHDVNPTEASLHTSGNTSMVFVYLMTAAIVLFLVWFNRSRRNARGITPGSLPESAVSATVVWFMPIVNLMLPRKFVLDLQRASAPAATGARPGTGSGTGTGTGTKADKGTGTGSEAGKGTATGAGTETGKGTATGAGAPSRGAVGKRERVLVNVWWGAWVAHALAASVALAAAPTSLPLLVVSEVLMVAAGALVICVIQRITALQDAPLAALSSGEPLART